jgi:hypothetical protein
LARPGPALRDLAPRDRALWVVVLLRVVVLVVEPPPDWFVSPIAAPTPNSAAKTPSTSATRA